MSDAENKTLSRLMSAVGKSKIYKDTSKMVENIAYKTVECAAKTTTKASKHYVKMMKKYDDDSVSQDGVSQDTVKIHPTIIHDMHYPRNALGAQHPQQDALCNTGDTIGHPDAYIRMNNECASDMIDSVIIPKYRIVKRSELPKLAESTETLNQSIICYIELPGVRSSTIELTFYYSEMTISAKKNYPIGLGNKKHDSIISESIIGNTQYGDIVCKLQLPLNVNEPHKVETNYIDGVLIVSIPTMQYIEPIVVKYKKSRSKNI